MAEGAIVPFAQRGQEACASFSCAFHLEKDTQVVRYPCPFILSTQKRRRRTEGAGRKELPTWRREERIETEKEDSRENYRFGCTALKSASSPLTGGIEFFPDAESSWHRVRTAPPIPPARPLPRATHTRVPAGSPSSRPTSPSTHPPPSPGIPRTAVSQSRRRVARSNCASRRRRANAAAAMELTRAAPL